jgi:hypothetical protein
MELGTKDHCVGKDQQQFSSQSVGQSTRQLFRGLHDPQIHETVEYGHESHRNLPDQPASQKDSVSLCVRVYRRWQVSECTPESTPLEGINQ